MFDMRPGEQRYIEEAIAAGHCFAAVVDSRPVGYAVLNYTFYDYGFISELLVDASYRRRGIGASLMARLVWCIRSSVVNKWVLYANPFLRFEQESGFLSFREPSNNVVNYGYRALAARPRNTVGECLGV